MTLTAGQRLGPYEIEALVGQGGMGEVYRAEDTRLKRRVAIKVLPSRATMDSELCARFDREAKIISSLNHPNICTLHDVGHADGIDFLVMEFLEGETLSEHIRRGGLNIDAALTTGAQITAALDAAHREGLVHRDLKPANVIISKDGAKLLDFGLAKLQSTAEDEPGEETREAPLTRDGAILGTVQYMAPEQLEGHAADARSDIFAFGSILYEMVTGQRPFTGGSRASLIGSILKDQPPAPSDLLPSIPTLVDRIIMKCLAKDPDNRWQTARDLRDELIWIARADPLEAANSPSGSKSRVLSLLVWPLAVALFGIGILLWPGKQEQDRAARVLRFSVPGTKDSHVLGRPRFSPDGSMIAFRAEDAAGESRLCVRPLNTQEAYFLPGTEGAEQAIWSPDSRQIAFFASNQLKSTSATGGPVRLICETGYKGYTGVWTSQGEILFDGALRTIMRVPASGGEPRAATRLDSAKGEFFHLFPTLLPDGEHFVYAVLGDTSTSPESYWETQSHVLASLGSGKTQPFMDANSEIQFVAPGYLIYLRGTLLVAHPCDEYGLTFTGDPLPIVDGIGIDDNGFAGFAVSATGDLIYKQGEVFPRSILAWVDRKGHVLDTIAGPAVFADVALSPNDSKMAYVVRRQDTKSLEIMIRDLVHGGEVRITDDSLDYITPIWTDDGSKICYSTVTGRLLRASYKASTGRGSQIPINLADTLSNVLVQWTIDGRLLMLAADGPTPPNPPFIAIAHIDNPGNFSLLLDDAHKKAPMGLSPDGRYLLYVEFGAPSVLYLLDMENTSVRWQLAIGNPEDLFGIWHPDGSEIFYWRGKDFMSIPLSYVDDALIPGEPRKLFSMARTHLAYRTKSGFDASHDGEKFVILLPAQYQQPDTTQFNVVLNWRAELGDGSSP